MSSGIHLWYRFWTANLLTLSSIINETVHYLELEWEINSSLSKMEFSQPLQSSTAAPMEHMHAHTHTHKGRGKNAAHVQSTREAQPSHVPSGHGLQI